MNLDSITPLILTYNEEPNLYAVLDALRWAKQIVIVDSGSTDNTLVIAKQFPQVAVYCREFDHFAEQCNFGLTKIETPWTLSLDADYRCPTDLWSEIQQREPANFGGFRVSFRYGVFGRPLRSSLYPPRIVLYQTRLARYERDGHAHRVSIDGEVGMLRTKLLHDDHKSLHGWFLSQAKYVQLEAEKLTSASTRLGWKDRIRQKIFLAPVLILFYCIVVKGLWLDGRAGLYYTSQRVIAEWMLSLTLLDRYLRRVAKRAAGKQTWVAGDVVPNRKRVP